MRESFGLHILLVLTARFQRVSWKYELIAYATILKGVGVLYQTMYLVATAMRLAPCAIGAGDFGSVPSHSRQRLLRGEFSRRIHARRTGMTW